VSQCYAIDCYRSVILLCSVLCHFGLCEIQFRKKSFHLPLLYEKTSYKSCRRKFCLKFPYTTCPSGETLSKLSKESSNPQHFNWQKAIKRVLCFNWGNLDDTCRHLENSPQKPLRQLALQSGVSVGWAWTATELLHIRPYKITVVPEIKPVDCEKGLRFCNWFTNHVHERLLDFKLTVFTNVDNFNLSG
jgi:hypothetical protein